MQVMSFNSGGTNLVDQMVNDPTYTGENVLPGLYPFKARCTVIKARPPRHPEFEFLLEIGRSNIDKVFDLTPIGKDGETLTFFMPERHMSVQEQRMFMSYLTRNPNAGLWELVDIITSSPIMISDFPAEQVRVLSYPDDPALGG